jgi:hypothetical protein
MRLLVPIKFAWGFIFYTMAENKKSFILYADLLHTIELMPDENAGKLFKHILKYVNDLNPEAEDLITKLSFEPIKQQLKRDLNSWEKTLEIKSDSGKMGNLKRWHKDLYLQVIENKINIDEALVIAHHRKTSHTDTLPSHPIAKIAVNVNDNVNVNVIKEPKVLSDFEKTFEDFRSMRNKIRKPMTPKAEELLLNKLQKMCGSNELLKIKLLNQSIINCWQDIYDIKIEKKQTTGGDINGVNIDNIKY